MSPRRTAITLALLAAAALPVNSQGLPNALWNDSGPKGVVGFWLYRATGGCPDLRSKDKPLVFAAKSASSDHAVNDLWYCFALPEQGNSSPNQCRTGSVHLELDAAERKYTGKYSFELMDGTKREGEFIATYCPKEQR